ncbi:hypothetical protein K0M31_020325 [Melipona bicolor]|uniref:Uncharacterized protein n=1 Tax=Melipona bicolor TaxID=60889 RepID=A0AA40G1D7_9HYME|nr:hypothetical protein K0M31_020325 [Melipona bicolor]
MPWNVSSTDLRKTRTAIHKWFELEEAVKKGKREGAKIQRYLSADPFCRHVNPVACYSGTCRWESPLKFTVTVSPDARARYFSRSYAQDCPGHEIDRTTTKPLY